MNKKGVTILELLISISLISIVILFLMKVMFSLNNINNDETYASSDEISRTEIIKNIESDFLKLKLQGIEIKNEESLIIKFTYDNETKTLESKNATYDLCPKYEYVSLDDNYYLIKINISVLINNENTTENDDLILTYIGLKKDPNVYPEKHICSN